VHTARPQRERRQTSLELIVIFSTLPLGEVTLRDIVQALGVADLIELPLDGLGTQLAAHLIDRERPIHPRQSRIGADSLHLSWSFDRDDLEVDASRRLHSGELRHGHAGDLADQVALWLAIIAVPTAIAGIYGMNFKHMPELEWEYGYFTIIGTILVVCAALFWRFRRVGWL